MVRVRKIIVLGLTLATVMATAAPLFACIVPQQSADSHGCCPKPLATFEQSKAPTGATCCQASRAQTPQLLTSGSGSPSHALIALLPQTGMFAATSTPASPKFESSPPGASTGCNAILRI